MKKVITIMGSILSLFLLVIPVSAHVVVKPDTAGVAAFQTFTVGVPNEKDNPVTGLRLLIPEGLKSVSPNVKPGWKIDVKKEGSGDNEKVTEIDWSGGSIPSGQRDDFLFSAQVPSSETALKWKAYQTYQSGDIVSWDQEPMAKMSDADREKMEKTGKGPYSETKIVNDLKPSAKAMNQSNSQDATARNNLPMILSAVAIALSVIAFASRRK